MDINITHVEHIVIALIIQLALLTLVSARMAGAIAVALLFGREIAQHEYRLGIQRGWEWGETLPVGMFEGIFRGWTLDSALDILLPALACGLAAIMVKVKGIKSTKIIRPNPID
ncbi:MAG TPA: hypothetical protein VLO13_02070 [Halomonas sp.]|nr:hypothetical protein [Halomonas sp.]